MVVETIQLAQQTKSGLEIALNLIRGKTRQSFVLLAAFETTVQRHQVWRTIKPD